MEVRFKNIVTVQGSYTQQGLSNHITFMPIKSGATVPLSRQRENCRVIFRKSHKGEEAEKITHRPSDRKLVCCVNFQEAAGD